MSNTSPLTASHSSSGISGVARVVAGVIGAAVGYYSGAMFFLPMAFAVAAGFALVKALPSRKAVAAPAAIICGHVLWMILGVVVIRQWHPVLFDALLLTLGTVWLLARPGRGSTIYLCVLLTGEAFYTALQLPTLTIGSSDHRSRLVHLLLYANALVFTITCYIGARRAKLSEETVAIRTTDAQADGTQV